MIAAAALQVSINREREHVSEALVEGNFLMDALFWDFELIGIDCFKSNMNLRSRCGTAIS